MRKCVLFISILLFSVFTVYSQACDSGSAVMKLEGRSIDVSLVAGGNLWQGDEFSQQFEGNGGYRFPKDSNKNIFRNGGLIISGLNEKDEPVAASVGKFNNQHYYRPEASDFRPGPLTPDGEFATENCHRYNKLWRILGKELDQHKENADKYNTAGGGNIPIGEIPRGIRQWPGGYNPYSVDADGNPMVVDVLPWVDQDQNGKYDPTKGDYPQVAPYNSVWTVYHAAAENQSATGGEPLKIEVEQNVRSFNNSGIWGATSIYEFKIRNKGERIDSAFIGLNLMNNISSPLGGRNQILENKNSIVISKFKDLRYKTFPMVAVVFLQGPKQYVMDNQGNVKDSFRINDMNYFEIEEFADSTMHNFFSDASNTIDPNCKFTGEFQFVAGPATLMKNRPNTIQIAVLSKFCDPYDMVNCPEVDCISSEIDSIRNRQFPGGTVGVEEEKATNPSVQIYPNPARDFIRMTIADHLAKEDLSVTITNMDGTQVKKLALRQSAKPIDITSLPQGIYIISIKNQRKSIATKKLVKIK